MLWESSVEGEMSGNPNVKQTLQGILRTAFCIAEVDILFAEQHTVVASKPLCYSNVCKQCKQVLVLANLQF